MKPRSFIFFMANLRVRRAKSEKLTPVELTLMMVKAEIDQLRERRARAKSFVRVMGEDATELTYPDSFDKGLLTAVEGICFDPAKGESVVGINDYVATSMHLQLTAVFSGPPGVGKTPLAEAIAARFARMYQAGEGECYIVTSTPDSLRLLSDEDLLTEGVPIILEELEAKDKSHARPLTANAMKHLCGVKDGGVMSARYRDFALNRRQPRMICCNGTMQQWLDGITFDERDRDALRKRIVFFHVPTNLVTQTTERDYAAELKSFYDAGIARLDAKLDGPL
jgi:hypothetical protein